MVSALGGHAVAAPTTGLTRMLALPVSNRAATVRGPFATPSSRRNPPQTPLPATPLLPKLLAAVGFRFRRA